MSGGGVDAQVLYAALAQCFQPQRFTDVFEKIGIQFHNTDWVKKVYLATFASVPVLQTILAKNTPDTLLFTHHPVPPKVHEDGAYGVIPADILSQMRQKRLSLFSYHIPMDCHGRYSPSKTLANALGFQARESFYYQNGGEMGVICDTGLSAVQQVVSALEQTLALPVKLYPYGAQTLLSGKVAIMAGGARNPDIYTFLQDQGVNAFVTGVTSKAISWTRAIHEQAQQHAVNLIGTTHCASEMFAPMAMAEFFENFALPTQFIPDTPNLADL